MRVDGTAADFRQVIFRQIMRCFIRNIAAVGGTERPMAATHEPLEVNGEW